MSSIYQRALGADFDRLHPMVQRRFGFSSEDGVASIGTGVMEEIWRGAAFTVPFLWLGSWRRIMFPDRGRNVPFRIENYAYRDTLGRETVSWLRSFEMRGRPRRFDAYMIHSEARGGIVDYLGTHQHLAVDIELRVEERGGLALRSADQRFHERAVSFRFPLIFSGIADVHEWYDDDEQRYRIEVRVANHRWGPLFGYRGWFTAEQIDCSAVDVPAHVLPRRVEARE
jgi:hypothetical protein